MPSLLGAAWVFASMISLNGSCATSLPRSPVVIELFTSQGCSSCPDADALLSGWGKEQFLKGLVIPLSYDVDYWDYLGWKDVFSQPAYSQRQRRYASALRVGVYTPQIVVAGRRAFVGSDSTTLAEAVTRARDQQPRVKIRISSAVSDGLRLIVVARSQEKQVGDWRVMLAFFENGKVTDVLTGENRGHSLRNDFVVRRLIELGRLPENGAEFHKSIDEPWDPAWRKDRAGVAVFIQDAATLEIYDASSLYPLTAAL